MQLALKGFMCPCLVVLIAILINVTSALKCTNCLEPKSCRSSPEAVECTVDNASLHQRLLGYQNPNLAAAVAGSDGFKCFDLRMTYISPLSGATIVLDEKGCTYAGTDFCSGWVSTAQVESCSTCDSADECNK